jgi:salicylate hydroxylase
VPSNVDEMLAAFPHVGEKLRRMMASATSCSKWGQFTGEHAPQWTEGRVTLLGDSAHAMLATFGQGANMAFEDAYVLSRWLRAKTDDPVAALVGYEAVRKPRATKVQQLSRTEVRFKKQRSKWDRLRRQWTFITRHGLTTGGVYRWIFSYDPVSQWQGRGA